MDELKIGDIVKTIKSFKGIEYEKERGAYFISCITKSGKKGRIDCYEDMLNKTFIILGSTRWINVFNVVSIEDRGRWNVPSVLMMPSKKRIIDMRKLGNKGLKFKAPDDLEMPVTNKSKKYQNMKVEDYRRFYHKWFIDKKTTTKKLLTEAIRTYNKYGCLRCPRCHYEISANNFYHISYTRAQRIFIKCPSCSRKYYVVSCYHNNDDNSQFKFQLCKLGE